MVQQSYLAVLGLWLLVVMAPGPDTLAVAAVSARSSRRDGLLVAFGCAVATAIWATGSMLGLALLFASASWLFTAVKLAGAAYLIYLGVGLILGALRRDTEGRSACSAQPGAITGLAAFRLGLFTDLANPKAAAFFSSLFAVALPADAEIQVKAAMVASVGIVALGWYAIVAVMLSMAPIASCYAAARRWIEGLAGALFVAFGAKLAFSRG
jgi:threonine/homoserine/homoserine lactone efflux protein